jgi:polar amino acid transport system substrate-binding protein
MIRTSLRLLALALLLGLGACSTFGGGSEADSAPTSPSLAAIVESGILRVGMTGTQPPFNVKTRSGQIIGMEADLVNALAETMGVRAEFVEIPFGDLLTALEAGEIDMVISQMTMTPERNTRVAFAGPYFISGKAILTKSDVLARADEAADIDQTGIRLAALAGSTSERFIKDSVPSARLIATTDYDQGVQLVINNDVDGLVADLPICVISVLRYPEAGLATVASPFTFEPLGVALPANDPLFINLVQNYMNMLEGTGLMDQLRSKWFDDASWLDELP